MTTVRIIFVLLLAAWTTTVWGGNPAWLLIGAALSGIAVLCAPVREVAG